MITYRTERVFHVPRAIFSDSLICLERMGVTITKKEVLKDEGDNFDGIIEGTRTSRARRLIIRLKIHGWRDMERHGGFWPTAKTTDVMIETFEISENDKELPDTPDAKALNEEFNDRFNLYVWGKGA